MCEQNKAPDEGEEIKEAEESQEPTEAVSQSAAEDTPQGEEKPPKKGRAKKIILRILLIIGIFLLAAVVALAVTVLIMRHVGEKSLKQEPVKLSPLEDSKIETSPGDGDFTVEYKGEKYAYNENILAFVVMGIDKEDINEVVGAGDNGQSDVVFLVLADTADGSVDMVSVSAQKSASAAV